MTLAEVRKRFANRLALNLNAAALEANFCEHLANILEPYRRVKTNIEQAAITASENNSETGCGNKVVMDEHEGCQVVINYERSDFRGCIMLGQDWLVSPTDDLIQRLRMEYGKEKVVLDYERGTIIN